MPDIETWNPLEHAHVIERVNTARALLVDAACEALTAGVPASEVVRLLMGEHEPPPAVRAALRVLTKRLDPEQLAAALRAAPDSLDDENGAGDDAPAAA